MTFGALPSNKVHAQYETADNTTSNTIRVVKKWDGAPLKEGETYPDVWFQLVKNGENVEGQCVRYEGQDIIFTTDGNIEDYTVIETDKDGNPWSYDGYTTAEPVYGEIKRTPIKEEVNDGDGYLSGLKIRIQDEEGNDKSAFCINMNKTFDFSVVNPGSFKGVSLDELLSLADSPANPDGSNDAFVTKIKSIIWYAENNKAALTNDLTSKDLALYYMIQGAIWATTDSAPIDDIKTHIARIFGGESTARDKCMCDGMESILTGAEIVTEAQYSTVALHLYQPVGNGNDEEIQNILTYDLNTPQATKAERTITFTNTKTENTTVYFSKKALSEDGEELSGATIQLSKQDGTLIKEWVTDGSIIEFKLEDGSYTFTETTAPENYEISTAITFTVKDGTVFINNTAVNGNTIVMVDQLKDTPKETPKTNTQTPHTGNMVQPELYAGILLIGIGALILICFKKKEDK